MVLALNVRTSIVTPASSERVAALGASRARHDGRFVRLRAPSRFCVPAGSRAIASPNARISPSRRQIPHLDEAVAAVGEMRKDPAPAIEVPPL